MRYLLILKRFIKSFKLWNIYRLEFNAKIAFWMSFVYVFPSFKNQSYINALENYFAKELSELITEYRSNESTFLEATPNSNRTIWTCWLTGYDSMPELIKLCYNRLKKIAQNINSDLILITLNNYNEYIELPDYIISKFHSGKISSAHLSDIIRFSLLSKYGGMWLDSTVYVSDTIPTDYLEAYYYTQKTSNPSLHLKEPSQARWCGFIWSGAAKNPLFTFVKDGLLNYWKNHDIVIDYIFFDYIIISAYNGLPYIKKMIESQQPNNEKIWELWNIINQTYDKSKIFNIYKENIFHKLTYKTDLFKHDKDGHLTTYGFLLTEQEKFKIT